MPTSSKQFDRIRTTVEFAANLALVVAVIVGVTVWLRRPSTTGALNNMSVAGRVSQYPTIGTQITLPGVNLGANKATLVVAISSSCHYCVASTPFYSEITHASHITPIVVVMPQEEQEARNFLSEHAISPRYVVSANLASIQVNATPTLLLVSSTGVVSKEWIGELSDTQRRDVMRSLNAI